MNDNSGISDEDLHAFIDGELDPVRAAGIAQLVNSNPALAARVAAFRSDRNRIAQMYRQTSDLPLPSEWTRSVESWASRPRWRSKVKVTRRSVLALAASLLLMFGLGVLYDRFQAAREEPIVAEALAARQQSSRAQEVFSGESITSADQRSGILTAALSMELKAPDLTKMGYRLDDIRVYSGVPGGKGVALTYRDERNRIFTLYVRHPSGAPRVDLTQRDGTRICIWQDDVVGTVMLGEMSAGEMARIASLTYTGLNL